MSMVDKQQSGFALLVSLIVVGAVLSVGLVILDLTIKQVRLAATTKDSEIAFHAANAGMECARYWRRTEADNIVAGNDMTGVTCFGEFADVDPVTATEVTGSIVGGGSAHQYEYQFSWGPTDARRCTRINQVSIVTPISDPDAVMTVDSMASLIPGYPGSADVTCPAGSQCTTIAVRGYNQECPSAGSNFGYGVVERKVLLEF